MVDPADVVQDVFLEAMRRAPEFRPVDADHTRRWLTTIARHRLVDLYRHHTADKRGGGGATGDDLTVSLLARVAADGRTPSASAAAHEVVAMVRRAIAELPPDYAAVLQLRFLDGRSSRSVAAHLHRTEGAVHVLAHRALAALRARLRPPAD